MRFRLFTLAVLTSLLGLNCTNDASKSRKINTYSTSKSIEAKSQLITCGGIGDIKFSDSMVSLERKVGKANIVQDSVFMEGAFQYIATKLWKNTEREIVVYWKEENVPYKTVRSLAITNPKSPYRFANGIGIGTTMEELVRLNGKVPISFMDFEIDHYLAGLFDSFNEGELSREIPCFGGQFDYQGDAMGITGDDIFKSDNPAVKKNKLKLIMIGILNDQD